MLTDERQSSPANYVSASRRRNAPLARWLDYGRIGSGCSWANLRVAHAATQQRGVYESAAHKRCRHDSGEGHASRYGQLPPTHERNERQDAERDAKVVRLFAHLLVVVDQLATNPRVTANRILRSFAAEVCDRTRDGRSDQNDEGCSPQCVGGCEIRREQQYKREERSEDRGVV